MKKEQIDKGWVIENSKKDFWNKANVIFTGLAVFFTLLLTILGFTWYLSASITRTETNLNQLIQLISDLKTEIKEIKYDIKGIESRLTKVESLIQK
jgi:hypothetical protein